MFTSELMRYAIFGCVHGNLTALQMVLRDARQNACTDFAFLGDAVGYGRQPKECVDLLRSLGMAAVKGNHDEYACSDEPLKAFNPPALENLLWTRAQLTDEDRQWLRALPYVRQLSGFTVVHAILDQPARWEYVFDKLAAANHFQFQNTPVCFFAHTHVPVAFTRDTVVRGGTYSTLRVEPGRM